MTEDLETEPFASMTFKYSILKQNVLACFELLHYYLVKLFTHNALLISGMVYYKKGKPIHNNWGDDLNVFLIEYLTNKRVFVCPDCFLTRKLHPRRYMVIGSILTFYPLDNAVILGSGIINQNKISLLSGTPSDVKFVRGPLTMNALKNKGIACPPIFGDPAIILPLVYTPPPSYKNKRYRIGIVPHYLDMNLPIVKEILDVYGDDVVNIKMKGYDCWTDIVDLINCCDFVLSSSLHGIIVSEAYNIPVCWVYFQDYIEGWDFKFHDFYMSIKKTEINPVKITNVNQVEGLYNSREKMRSNSDTAIDKLHLRNLLVESLK